MYRYRQKGYIEQHSCISFINEHIINIFRQFSRNIFSKKMRIISGNDKVLEFQNQSGHIEILGTSHKITIKNSDIVINIMGNKNTIFVESCKVKITICGNQNNITFLGQCQVSYGVSGSVNKLTVKKQSTKNSWKTLYDNGRSNIIEYNYLIENQQIREAQQPSLNLYGPQNDLNSHLIRQFISVLQQDDDTSLQQRNVQNQNVQQRNLHNIPTFGSIRQVLNRQDSYVPTFLRANSNRPNRQRPLRSANRIDNSRQQQGRQASRIHQTLNNPNRWSRSTSRSRPLPQIPLVSQSPSRRRIPEIPPHFAYLNPQQTSMNQIYLRQTQQQTNRIDLLNDSAQLLDNRSQNSWEQLLYTNRPTGNSSWDYLFTNSRQAQYTQKDLQLLPKSQYTGKQMKCTICLEYVEKKETVMFLFCLHGFHADCCTRWLQNSLTCPICKLDIREQIKKEKARKYN